MGYAVIVRLHSNTSQIQGQRAASCVVLIHEQKDIAEIEAVHIAEAANNCFACEQNSMYMLPTKVVVLAVNEYPFHCNSKGCV